MKDVIYLTIDQRGVQAMRKSYTGARRGEVIVKLNVEVPKEAFNPPVLEQRVYVNDWRDGIDLEDVQFKQNVITEEEAELVRQRRLEKMSRILAEQGYKVEPPESEDAK